MWSALKLSCGQGRWTDQGCDDQGFKQANYNELSFKFQWLVHFNDQFDEITQQNETETLTDKKVST